MIKEEKTVEVLIQNPDRDGRILILTPKQYDLLKWLYDYEWLSDNTTYDDACDIEKIDLT